MHPELDFTRLQTTKQNLSASVKRCETNFVISSQWASRLLSIFQEWQKRASQSCHMAFCKSEHHQTTDPDNNIMTNDFKKKHKAEMQNWITSHLVLHAEATLVIWTTWPLVIFKSVSQIKKGFRAVSLPCTASQPRRQAQAKGAFSWNAFSSAKDRTWV